MLAAFHCESHHCTVSPLPNLILVYRNGSRQGQEVPINDSEFLIGRQADCHLCLDSRTISRRHCAIFQRDSMVMIVDLGSRNPTLVNGQPLDKKSPHCLYDRDKIQVGRIKFRILIEDSRTTKKTPPKKVSPTRTVLNELNQIALDFAKPSACRNEMSTLTLGVLETPFVDGGNVKFEEPVSGSLELSVIESPNVDVPSDLDKPPGKTSHVDDAGTIELESGPAGPKKLPAHLRPKGPADSQGAAEIALRNMFNRR